MPSDETFAMGNGLRVSNDRALNIRFSPEFLITYSVGHGHARAHIRQIKGTLKTG
jgi:hypothetical protein